MTNELLEPIEPPPSLAEEEEPDIGRRPAYEGRLPWDPDDSLYSDRRRYLNMQYWLRQSQTVSRMLFDYGFMDLSNVGIAIKNLRRMIQVHPPKFFIDSLPWDQRYLEVLVPRKKRGKKLGRALKDFVKVGEDEDITEIGVFGAGDEGLPRPDLGHMPSEVGKNLELRFLPQDWWVFCGVKSEANARKPTGLLQMPYDEVAAAVREKLLLKEGAVRTARSLDEQIEIIRGIREARRQVSGLYVLDRRPLEVTGYCLHRRCWEAFNEYQRLRKDKDPAAESKRLIQFNTGERFDHMQLARGLADVVFAARDPETADPRFANTQTIKESIKAEEMLLDMVSTVLRKPLLTIYQVKGRGYQARVLHVEIVVFASEDELNDLRKTVDHRKQWLRLERAKALAKVTTSDVTGAPDKWYFGSADPTPLRDIAFPKLIDPASYLGYVWDLALEWASLTGNDPLDYELPAAPQIGGWHLREIQALSDSFNTLMEMAEQVRNGGLITDRHMREKYLPKLVQYEPEVRPGVPSVIWTYWHERKPHTFGEWQAAGRPKEWEPHAVPYRDIALWYDWWWTMGGDQYVYPELIEHVNRKFGEAGLPAAVRVTADGPDSNYFRHHDIAWEIWRNQPGSPLIQRLKEVWNTEVSKKTVHIRPVYYKEVLAGLSQEVLGDLSTPDKSIIDDLIAKTEAELRVLPAGEVVIRRKLEERLRRLAGALPEAKELDPLTRFVQKLNRMSDRRFRLWAGFQSHGTKGGIMGFQIGEAVSAVKEGYASDNGYPNTENTEIAGDLIHLGWHNSQFSKAVYLARGLSYMVATNANPFERHKAIGGAIIGGLHPDIAHHVAEGFKGLTELLSLQGEQKAARYVKNVFESHEIARLGRTIVKDILEGLAYRREMDRMKV